MVRRVMYLPKRGCFTSHWISTRRVLSILSRVTTPVSTRRFPRPSGAVAFVTGVAAFAAGGGSAMGGLLLRGLLLVFRYHGQDPRDVPLRFAVLGGRLQPAGRAVH